MMGHLFEAELGRSVGSLIRRGILRSCRSVVRQRGARIMGAVALTPTRSGSGEADIARASQVQHTIEDVGGAVHLGRPTLIRMRAQSIADHLLPSADGGLGPGAFRVAGRRLP